MLLDASQTSGTGVLRDAHSDLATNWTGYALNRRIMPYVEIGAESIAYDTTPRLLIDDAVWELGVVLTPNPDSQLTIGYGHHQGATSFDVQGHYALSARTRLTASYTTGLATDAQQIQSQLGLADFDQFGGVVNADTGAPLFLGNGLLSTQDGLFRNHTLSLTATTLLNRDKVAVSVEHQAQTPVGSTPLAGGGVGQAIGQDATTFTAAWTHQLSERTSLGASGSYTTTTVQTVSAGRERVVAATAGASYRLSETISTVARYTLLDRDSDYAGRSFTDNVFLVGITKRF